MAVTQLVIFAGQSQCNSNGNTSAQTVPTAIAGPMTDVYIWDPFGKAWLMYQAQVTSAAHLKGGKYPDTSQNYFGAEAEYARRWKVDNPGVPLYMVKKGHSSTSLSQAARTANRGCWDNNLRDDLFDEFVAQVADAKANLTATGNTVNIREMNWIQGENDAGSTRDVASAYFNNLNTFIDAVRTSGVISATTPFIVSRIQTASWSFPAPVRAAQQAIGETKPYCRWVNADSVAIDGADTVHYGPNGVVTLGALIYAAANGATAYPVYPTITMGPAQLGIVSGSIVQDTDFDGVAMFKLPNTTCEIAAIPDLALGIKYDVFINWSVSVAASAGSYVQFAGASTPWVVGGATPSGSSIWSKVPPPPVGTAARTQLPWSMTRASANDIARIRMGRRTDNVGGNLHIRSIEFVPTAAAVEATVTQAGNVTPTATTLGLTGSVDVHGFSIYTPLRSSATATYVVEPMTVGGQQQSRIAKLNKSNYAVLQDVQIGALNHDSIVGHRDGSVVVTDSGKVICYPEGHHAPWTGKIALTEDLTALTSMAVPVGLDKHCSYRRFFRNPFDGSTWMAARGNDYLAGVWKFSDSNNTFERKPSGAMVAGDSGSFLGSYGMEIAFGSADVIYATTEFYQGTTSSTLSGYPRQNLSVIRSLDGGTTWQALGGGSLLLPIAQMSVDDIAFPANNSQHNGVYGRLAVGTDGQPILVATWQHPSDSTRALWVAKWDNTAKKWIRRRLFRATTAFDVGNPHIAEHNGKIIVSISTTDDHTPGPSSSGGGGERVPPNNNILLFVTTDSAATWRRYNVNHLAGGYGGAYIDAEALRLDNKLRMRPVNASAPTTSVIWEMPVPDVSDTIAPVMNGSITISSITSSGFTLTCDAATDAVGVAGYEYSIDGGTTYIAIPNAARTVVISGRPAATAHPVRMRALDATGNYSTPLSTTATTLAAADTTAPVMTGSITVSNVTTSGATISCPAATDAVGVVGYEYSINGGTNYTLIANGARSVTITGRPEGTEHQVRMRALDAAGNRSQTPLSATFTTAITTPASGAIVGSTVAESRRVAFPGGTRVIPFGRASGVGTPNAPYMEGGKWWTTKHPLDERYWVADITIDLLERNTTATAVEALVAGVTILQQPVIQGKLVPIKLGGFNAAVNAVNFCTFRVTCADGQRFDRTIWFKQQTGVYSLAKDPDDQSYYVGDISSDLTDSNTTATAVLAQPVGVSVLAAAVIQGPLIVVKLGGLDTLPAGVNYCDLRIDCANTERFYRTIQFTGVDN